MRPLAWGRQEGKHSEGGLYSPRHKEIGGTCVEIESRGQRIVIDVVLPLDVSDPEMFPLHRLQPLPINSPSA